MINKYKYINTIGNNSISDNKLLLSVVVLLLFNDQLIYNDRIMFCIL